MVPICRQGLLTQEGARPRLGEELGERLGETRAAIIRAMLDNPTVSTTQLALGGLGLLRLANRLLEELADLHPKDLIDIQSFIWCVAR